MSEHETAACPSCDSARSLNYRKTKDSWICYECHHVFAEPNYRESKQTSKIGLGSPLLDLDAEEVP